jgi:RHS repeat-associated protein
MTTRNADGKSYTFAYDAENRLISVSGDSTATFVYNGDGQRVKSVMDGGTTLFVGGYYEIANPGAGQTITKYYMAGASRVALRKDGTLSYTLADHLGSTSLVTDANGNRTSELRYKPWGETRFSFGTMPTKYTFTGQFSYMDDPSTPGLEGFGLMYYGARWADVSLGRFAQADTVVSGGPQGLDRYAYGLNNPVKYSDPTGHMADQGDGGSPIAISIALQVTPLKQEKGDSCGESAFTMAYNHSHRTDISETEVRNTAEENKWFTPGVLPFTSPSQMEDIANHYTNGNYESGQITNSRDGYNLLLSQLQSGNTIIVDYVVDPNNVSGTGSDAHFVVVTGMTNNNGQIMITYNDPWTGQQTTMDWYTFSTAWLTNNDDHGAGNGWWMVVPPVDCNTDPSNPECQPPTSTPTSTPPQ